MSDKKSSTNPALYHSARKQGDYLKKEGVRLGGTGDSSAGSGRQRNFTEQRGVDGNGSLTSEEKKALSSTLTSFDFALGRVYESLVEHDAEETPDSQSRDDASEADRTPPEADLYKLVNYLAQDENRELLVKVAVDPRLLLDESLLRNSGIGRDAIGHLQNDRSNIESRINRDIQQLQIQAAGKDQSGDESTLGKSVKGIAGSLFDAADVSLELGGQLVNPLNLPAVTAIFNGARQTVAETKELITGEKLKTRLEPIMQGKGISGRADQKKFQQRQEIIFGTDDREDGPREQSAPPINRGERDDDNSVGRGF